MGLLLDLDPSHEYRGLDDFPADERPGMPNAVFQFYHIMVACGMAMIALLLAAAYLLWRGELTAAGLRQNRWRRTVGSALVAGVLLPQIANQTGWYAAEMGRQPWVVYGHLRTSDALSEAVVAEQVLFSLIGFTIVYLILFLLFIYLMNKKIQHGPEDGERPGGNENPDHRPLTEEVAREVEKIYR